MFDLSFGNSVCVREAFVKASLGNPIQFGNEELLRFDYPSHEGDPKLVEITRSVIKRQIGTDYKHVFITNGATGGVTAALMTYKLRGVDYCHTRNAPYYARYPEIIKSAGMIHNDETFIQLQRESVWLLDTPSNPLGELKSPNIKPEIPVILDAVYLNNVYTAFTIGIPAHNVLVGSYSKLLGINGIRLGWIATNDDSLAKELKAVITSQYCGLSVASTEILKHYMVGFNWEQFEQSARMKLDYNREEWAQLEKYFHNEPVKMHGMFYYAPFDKKCRELLTKAGIKWTVGQTMGTSEDYGRINLGQDNDLIAKAVEAILKADRIRK